MTILDRESEHFNYLVDCYKKYNKHIEKIKPLSSGLSGSYVYLVEILEENKRPKFAVVKVGIKNKNQEDLKKEEKGFKKFKEIKYFEDYMPIYSEKIELNNITYLISSFVKENKTYNINSLKDSLITNFDKTINILDLLKKKIFEHYNSSSKDFIFNSFEHFKKIISNENFEKIVNEKIFKWEEFNINKNSSFISVNLINKPNIINLLTNNNIKWLNEKFSLKYQYIHGDLNSNNIIVLEDEDNFKFIDFEKVKEGNIFYDIGFLITCLFDKLIIQNSTEKDNDYLFETIEIFASKFDKNKIYEFETRYYRNKPFFEIINKLIDFEQINNHQNLLKGFIISIAAASLMRAFYEFRDYKKNQKKLDEKELNLKFRKGNYFYILSCFLIDNPLLIKKEIDSFSSINILKVPGKFDYFYYNINNFKLSSSKIKIIYKIEQNYQEIKNNYKILEIENIRKNPNYLSIGTFEKNHLQEKQEKFEKIINSYFKEIVFEKIQLPKSNSYIIKINKSYHKEIVLNYIDIIAFNKNNFYLGLEFDLNESTITENIKFINDFKNRIINNKNKNQIINYINEIITKRKEEFLLNFLLFKEENNNYLKDPKIEITNPINNIFKYLENSFSLSKKWNVNEIYKNNLIGYNYYLVNFNNIFSIFPYSKENESNRSILLNRSYYFLYLISKEFKEKYNEKYKINKFYNEILNLLEHDNNRKRFFENIFNFL